jgi:chemotaxis signal transduction protein
LAGVKGLAVIRGHGVPVLDLAEILQKEPNIVGRFVTVRVGQRLCALAVSNVVGIKSISAEEHQDLPPLFRDLEATQGLAIFDHNVVLLLESARLFPMIQSIPEEEA